VVGGWVVGVWVVGSGLVIAGVVGVELVGVGLAVEGETPIVVYIIELLHIYVFLCSL
jgi:hypothetical protein